MLISIAELNVKKRAPRRWARGPLRPLEPCLLCGSWITGTTRMVELTTDGYVVYPGDGTCASVPNSQGGFPVGPDCWRKIVKAAKAKQEIAR